MVLHLAELHTMPVHLNLNVSPATEQVVAMASFMTRDVAGSISRYPCFACSMNAAAFAGVPPIPGRDCDRAALAHRVHLPATASPAESTRTRISVPGVHRPIGTMSLTLCSAED